MARRRGKEEGSSSRIRGETLVIDCGKQKSFCGYCKSSEHNSRSYGLWAQSITVDDYQELLDRGWRRSGAYLYKPEMEITCCPSYAIRLKVDNFIPSKEQQRVSKRMKRFLEGSFNSKQSKNLLDEKTSFKGSDDLFHCASSSSSNITLDCCRETKSIEDSNIKHLENEIDKAAIIEFPLSIQLPYASVKKVKAQSKKKLMDLSEGMVYTSSIPFQIAAAIRRSPSSETGQGSELSPNFVAEKLAFALNNQGELSELNVKACNGHLNFYSTNKECAQIESSDTLKSSGAKCSYMVHDVESPQQHKKHKLEIRLFKSSFDKKEYDLYRKYQLKVHNDAPDGITEASYINFLVDTPLIFVPPSENKRVPPCGFGSFHQQYLLDGQLIAVGVVDVLPKCLSSKYLFWDPDYAFLSLGKYSSLQEIDWIILTKKYCPSLEYYYLGYYIHSCRKMRYKAAYHPSELLCPLRYKWIPFDIAKPLLDKKAYVILSDFTMPQDGTFSPFQAQEDSVGSSNKNLRDASRSAVLGMRTGHSDSESDFNCDNEVHSDLLNDHIKPNDIDNTFIQLRGRRMKFKDLRQCIRPVFVNSLERQMRNYIRLVGTAFSRHATFSIDL